ncbi:hypothetical protein BH11ARM1_BH11ARM1_03470 [soil metagenome]
MEKVIVCGLGQIAIQTVDLLAQLGFETTVISIGGREEWIRRAQELGATYINGDARDEAFLIKAGIHDATSVIACTSNDSTNIEISLDAKRLNPNCRAIARIFDSILAERLTGLFDIETISTSSVTGTAFASASLVENVVSEFRIDDDHFLILRLDSEKQPQLVGKTVGHVQEQGFQVLMHLDAKGSVSFNPAPDQEIRPGDTVKIVGLAAEIRKVKEREQHLSFKQWFRKNVSPLNPLRFVSMVWRDTTSEVRGSFVSISLTILVSVFVFGYGLKLSALDAIYFVMETVTTVGYGDITPRSGPTWVIILSFFLMLLGVVWMVLMYVIVTDYLVAARLDQVSGRRGGPDGGHTIIVGIGDVGLRAAESLAYAGFPVIAVDRDLSGQHFRVATSRLATLVGDGREREILTRAKVESADAIIAITGDDATNLSIALEAKKLNPKIRAVLRISDSQLAEKVNLTNLLDGALSAKFLTAPTFAGAAAFPKVISSFVLEDHLIAISCDTAETETSFLFQIEGKKAHEIRVHTLPLNTKAKGSRAF